MVRAGSCDPLGANNDEQDESEDEAGSRVRHAISDPGADGVVGYRAVSQLVDASDEVDQLMAKNSLDHGIENPEVREAARKPRKGKMRLEAKQEGDQIVISVADDGAGIEPARIARKAVEKGLVTAERARKLTKRGRVQRSGFYAGSCRCSRLQPRYCRR